jgi:hypothetical protein
MKQIFLSTQDRLSTLVQEITFSKGNELYLHLERYKDTGNMYLYSASVKPPKNMEPLQ